jgi:nitrogen fixation/metabolism regulation signal transduction histidine kinase
MMVITLVVIGVVAVIVFFVPLFVAGRFSAPILLVSEGARRLAVGNIELAGMDWKQITKGNARKDELGLPATPSPG